jgi:DNA-binding transcriptional regulator PaaX
MSLVQDLLYAVSNYPGGYRIIYDLIYGSKPLSKMSDKEKREHVVRTTLSKLKKLGYITNREHKWRITPEGKEYLQSRAKGELRRWPQELEIRLSGKKKLIISFDIPEKRRKYRDWLRSELVGFGFEQIQKSVWFGPSLPKEFLDYLAEVRLLPYLRFFKASPEDIA